MYFASYVWFFPSERSAITSQCADDIGPSYYMKSICQKWDSNPRLENQTAT